MARLSDFMPPLDTREPFTLRSFLNYIVPAFLCYYGTAILVLIPNTLAIRLAVLPLSLWTCSTAATRIDLVKAYDNHELGYINHFYVIISTLMCLRLTVWSFQTRSYWRVRTLREMTSEFYTSNPTPVHLTRVFLDAFELLFNFRGCGWNWSLQLKIPQESRPTSSVRAFATATLTYLLPHLMLLDIYQFVMQWIAPTIFSMKGDSIFDATLPISLRYARSTLLSSLNLGILYSGLEVAYHIGTLFGVLVFRQDPSLWPPAFDSPLLSTSLIEFWAKRWHQYFRDVAISLAFKPAFFLFGRVGGILSLFTLCGIIHYFAVWGLGRGADIVYIGAFFIVHGIGIVLEHMWRNITGRRVGGWYGRGWVYLWLFGWGNMYAEVLATTGMIGTALVPPYLRLTTYTLNPLLNFISTHHG